MTEMIASMDALTTEQQELAAELVARARAEGVELTGPNGLLTGLTRQVLETALEAELAEHVGYDKHDPAGRNGGNSRNGTRTKTVLTDIGPCRSRCRGTGTARSIRRSCASGSAGFRA